MSSMNIAIKDEAYEFLKSLRGRDKSFSDVILEIRDEKSKKGNAQELLKFAGVLNDVDWNAREKRMKEFRKSFSKKMMTTAKLMEKARNDRH
jgi:predicted CopG family antitoxin